MADTSGLPHKYHDEIEADGFTVIRGVLTLNKSPNIDKLPKR
jgi:hypothetical protein